MERLLVVGGGPKAMAVAAKARVLRDLGLPAPQVVVVESHAVGGNWLPGGGWTDGRHRLGTSPEKDVGFPYRTIWAGAHNRAIDERMTEYSWASFLVDRGTYAEWIDRGRPSPHHHVWAEYLRWVAAKSEVEIVFATVRRIAPAADGWLVSVAGADGVETQIDADRLMITGPGDSRRALSEHPKVLSIADFWELAGKRKLPASSRAAVIGGGETAGSALDELIRHDVLSIAVVSPAPTIYTRGESYFENALYSDPARWRALSTAERREVVRRTDRGVISVRVQERLLGDDRVHHLRGRVVRAAAQGDAVALTLRTETHGDRAHAFDLVVDATGGQPLWFTDLFDSDAADLLELAVGGQVTTERVELAIGHDLAVEGLGAKLYLPNLAGLAQGPGFPNLSCLGELSDRVLGAPVAAEPVARSASLAFAPEVG
ncbi:SidA/IucD/PvdA family monooxygenase [Nocardia puris]|uniref:L-lysine N6-monooxygenase MbtG n=1 Tax=Nocardia puris TaxID=208602 RepID=A0A366DHG5_9NOCA|nr:SidA/IucD/PvdA family monooxygenase [Nocardia puris]MBF6211593.1 SidA/IucD/PvdA family monooxygenase [Nocardia puris]MBF6366845.1 SidA/IucD/PvdA family monooxygenase [Nocardia puris]MBF6460767.1 SidA/IucD/PvdA family monooxygenase [Nocardia puris]RBO88959.1 mycobactin lysine-N-oxygenase [Nocardia puris]